MKKTIVTKCALRLFCRIGTNDKPAGVVCPILSRILHKKVSFSNSASPTILNRPLANRISLFKHLYHFMKGKVINNLGAVEKGLPRVDRFRTLEFQVNGIYNLVHR
ncbi:hypothetical protein AVEN_203242-1 [Araneus ventricosus]|uniref:Uncharacterized protein n=1 Tax=Araneus ventricosus TaxID=182803 RepID=A0A4Y2F0L5_ARAVE|nr:hypothetical protein AVEN_203242-1 [Araneus ventricosus]